MAVARIRSIHPGQASDHEFVELSPWARLLCLLLRNFSDDNGVFPWKPKQIKMDIFPADSIDIEPLLAEMVAFNQCKRFEHDGQAFGVYRNFVKWQRPERAKLLYFLPSDLMEYAGFTQISTDSQAFERKALFEKQGGLCASCGCEITYYSKRSNSLELINAGEGQKAVCRECARKCEKPDSQCENPFSHSENAVSQDFATRKPDSQISRTDSQCETVIFSAEGEERRGKEGRGEERRGREVVPPDAAQAIEAYNAVAARAGLPKAQKIDADRRANLARRLEECGGLEGWHIAMAKMEASKFLLGDNDRGWRASFDFVLQRSSFRKLMEGQYDDRSHSGPASRRSREQQAIDNLKRRFSKGDPPA